MEYYSNKKKIEGGWGGEIRRKNLLPLIRERHRETERDRESERDRALGF